MALLIVSSRAQPLKSSQRLCDSVRKLERKNQVYAASAPGTRKTVRNTKATLTTRYTRLEMMIPIWRA
jgi:hypothetical protein